MLTELAQLGQPEPLIYLTVLAKGLVRLGLFRPRDPRNNDSSTNSELIRENIEVFTRL